MRLSRSWSLCLTLTLRGKAPCRGAVCVDRLLLLLTSVARYNRKVRHGQTCCIRGSTVLSRRHGVVGDLRQARRHWPLSWMLNMLVLVHTLARRGQGK